MGTKAPQLDLSDWTMFGDPCPCCGGPTDWEEDWDGPSGWWHEDRTDCQWRPGDGDEPCAEWPHNPAQ